MFKRFFGVLILGTLSLSIGCTGEPPNTSQSPSVAEDHNQQPAPPSERVEEAAAQVGGEVPKQDVTEAYSAADFIRARKKNEAHFEDRVIEITGPATDIQRFRKETIGVQGYQIEEGQWAGLWTGVECRFRESEIEKLASLVPTQEVVVEGRAGGSGAGGLLLSDCILKSAGPDPTIKVTVGELAEKFQTDADAAGQSFKGKFLEVSGEFVEKSGGEFSSFVLSADAAAEEGFRIYVSAGQLPDPPDLSPGQGLVARGLGGPWTTEHFSITDTTSIVAAE